MRRYLLICCCTLSCCKKPEQLSLRTTGGEPERLNGTWEIMSIRQIVINHQYDTVQDIDKMDSPFVHGPVENIVFYDKTFDVVSYSGLLHDIMSYGGSYRTNLRLDVVYLPSYDVRGVFSYSTPWDIDFRPGVIMELTNEAWHIDDKYLYKSISIRMCKIM